MGDLDRPSLQEILSRLPEQPGVYRMRDEAGQVIYVGKARSLRQRVRSYFHSPSALTRKVQVMVGHIAHIDTITTRNEVEALILEANLIKEHRPKYNVLLRDDKAYPYLVLTDEPFPRLLMARRRLQGGGRYFGPYPDAGAVHEAQRLLRRLFPMRTCSPQKFATADRPCLLYHIGRCGAPCAGLVGEAEYGALMEEVALFLEGRQDRVLQRLRQRMAERAESLEFEAAARIRDQIQAVERLAERQVMVSQKTGDMDVWAYRRSEGESLAMVFFVRDGRMIGRDIVDVAGSEDEEESAVMGAILSQWYRDRGQIPPVVLVPVLPADGLLPSLLKEWRSGSVRLLTAKRGEKAVLLAMAAENVERALRDRQEEEGRSGRRRREGLAGLMAALDLAAPPRRIEGYDISTLQGQETVASGVVFLDGESAPSEYRRYRMRSLEGQNDFAAMAETLRRRLTRGLKDEAEGRSHDWPDLILIDGGLGQMHAARAVMHELGLSRLPTVSLAKQEELLFQEGREEPIRLDLNSPPLLLLRGVRDEAHRFALGYHRQRRGKSLRRSLLEEIPGIGPRRRQALLRRFGSLRALERAGLEEILAVPGMNRQLAERILEHLGRPESPRGEDTGDQTKGGGA